MFVVDWRDFSDRLFIADEAVIGNLGGGKMMMRM